MSLQGKVVLITGAGRGIGRVIAQHFGRAGAAVGLLARSVDQLDETAALITNEGGRAFVAAADMTVGEQVTAAVANITAVLGPVEVLVNNAGSFDAIGPVAEVDADTWWRDCEINLRGPFLCCQAVLPAMLARKDGLIVNVIGGGTGNPFPYGSGYASSKAGLMRLTECLAGEVREAGITVLAMGPGFVRTQMTEYQATSAAGLKWIPSSATGLEKGQDVPPTLAAELAVTLASHVDELKPLTGRLFSAGEDVAAVIAQADGIIAGNKRTLRFC